MRQNSLLWLCHIDPTRSPCLSAMVLSRADRCCWQLRSGFASLSLFVSYLAVGLIYPAMRIWLLVLWIALGHALERKISPSPMTVSVIVPCAGQHLQFLPRLLEEYVKQTCLPDEIVISLSSVEHLKKEEIDALENRSWPFLLKILRFIGKQSPGLNRNLAAMQTGGDILISQDADDLPHPQRVEIVKFFFENYEIDHLLHKWLPEEGEIAIYDKTEIAVKHFDAYDEIYKTSFGDHLHNGNNALKREVARKIPWDDVKTLTSDHDVKFNRDVYDTFRNTLVIDCPLLIYRWKHSALQSNPTWP